MAPKKPKIIAWSNGSNTPEKENNRNTVNSDAKIPVIIKCAGGMLFFGLNARVEGIPTNTTRKYEITIAIKSSALLNGFPDACDKYI